MLKQGLSSSVSKLVKDSEKKNTPKNSKGFIPLNKASDRKRDEICVKRVKENMLN